MIYVDRSAYPIPKELASPRADAAREQVARVLTSSKERLEQTRIRFEPTIWHAAKSTLLELFHGKCAYCETKIYEPEVAEVQHFRPKDGIEDLDGKRSHYYYAWLTYDWENLLIACPDCYRFVDGKFPVKGERARLFASVAECRDTEDYMILDPCFDRPGQHLSFNQLGVCWARTERGQLTINILHLNRDRLCAERRRVWVQTRQDAMLAFNVLYEGGAPSRIVQALLDLGSADRPHAAVARAALAEFASQFGGSQIDVEAFPSSRRLLRPQEDETLPAEIRLGPDVIERVTAMSEPRRQYGDRAELPPQAYETIRRIEIRNFKAIETIDLEFHNRLPGEEESVPMLMLLGENATGKSTLLEAVALALLGTEHINKLQLDGRKFVRRPAWDDSRDEAVKPAEILIHFDPDKTVRLTIDPHSGQFEGNERPATVLLGYGPRRFFSDHRRARHHVDPSARVRTLFDPLAVISNPSGWLMNCAQPTFNAAIRALRELLLLPEDALLTRPPRGKRRGKEIMFEILGEPEPLRRLSEGYKTTIATGVDIMREMLRYWPDLEAARGIVLIDELDTHLHPRWKMRIVSRLRRAMPHVQFIATSHDPLCLRGLADGEAVVFRRNEDGEIEPLTNLPNVRGLSVEQLLTSEFFGLYSTEDPKFEDDVERYVALASRPELSSEERAELEHYRDVMHDTVVLSTPGERAIKTAVSEYVIEQMQTAQLSSKGLTEAAVRTMIDFWNSADVEDNEE